MFKLFKCLNFSPQIERIERICPVFLNLENYKKNLRESVESVVKKTDVNYPQETYMPYMFTVLSV